MQEGYLENAGVRLGGRVKGAWSVCDNVCSFISGAQNKGVTSMMKEISCDPSPRRTHTELDVLFID